MPLEVKILICRKYDLKLYFIRLMVIMKLQCLKLCSYINLQKSKFTTKDNLGSWVRQDTPQLSVTATQMNRYAIYMQDSKYITRSHILE